MIDIQRARGPDIEPWLDALAELRIRVFREWPYLYDGSAAYERRYLTDYATSPDSIVVLALAEHEVIGCSTGLPLNAADRAFQAPFAEAGFDLKRVFYFGESVLDQRWRGHGIGHRFFDERESHARALEFQQATFCAVQRSPDHRLCPHNYLPLDGFWAKRGYAPRGDLQTQFSWKDIDQHTETAKSMQFWLRDL
jgi:GNAT superfamily N-acetyltransferase